MVEEAQDPLVLKYRSRKHIGEGRMRDRLGLLKRFYFEFVRPHSGGLYIAAAAMALYAATVVALPWLFEQLVNNVFVNRDEAALYQLVGIVVVLFTVRAGAGFTQQYILARVGNHVALDAQRTFADHLLSLDLAFFQKNAIGQIISRGTSDISSLSNAASSLIIVMVRDVATLIGLIAYVAWTSPEWFVLTLIGGPMIAIPSILSTRRIRRLSHRAQELSGQLLGSFEEALHGIRGIKAEGNEDIERRRLGETIRQSRKNQLKAVRTQALLLPVVDFVTAFALVVVLLIGGRSVMSGETEPGALMAFVGALMLLYDPLRRVLQTNATLQRTMASLQRIYEVLDMRPRIVDVPKPAVLADPTGDVAFRDVVFGYEPDKPVLTGLSIDIPAGSTVAFVGPSGAGKTTVLNLIARLNEPSEGTIAIGGQDIGSVSLKSLRRNLALVAQDALLFDASIRENIAYGLGAVDDVRIWEAAAAADAADFIRSLPGGLDFRVGPRGTRISGGQRQRVVIARALLRDSPILLLDEATSALDSNTESRVLAAVTAARRNRTTIVIAHRLATVTGADRICFVDSGRVVESGKHQELLDLGGAYATAWRLQAGIS